MGNSVVKLVIGPCGMKSVKQYKSAAVSRGSAINDMKLSESVCSAESLIAEPNGEI